MYISINFCIMISILDDKVKYARFYSFNISFYYIIDLI